MSTLEENSSLNQRRKLNKKLKKYHQFLKQDANIEISDQPTKNLIICNTGLVNGLTEETIFEHFETHGVLSGIWMLPGKSFCYVSYEILDSAIQAYESFNGKLKIAQDNKSIYLLYTKKIPMQNSTTIWDELPPGLILIDNFVNLCEEQQLLDLCTFNEGTLNTMKNRQVKHYGFEFLYTINNVDKNKPLIEVVPTETNFLWSKLGKHKKEFENFKPNQLTINHYMPGQGIPHHIDTHSAFEDPIACLSLGSAIVMEFKTENKHINIMLPQRSLLIMSKESRYNWTHGIVPRKFDVVKNKSQSGFTCLKRGTRVSFTFRKVLTQPCCCTYKSKCDSVNKERTIKEEVASQLEELHVHKVYDNIADHFSDTRHKPWPNVLQFVHSFKSGDILVDIGCGNGKYLAKNPLIFDLGCDRSIGLIDICRIRNFEAFIADCLSIPLRDNSADGVISIAVLHHLATETRRIRGLKEIIRILKLGGQALIYVWAHDQMNNHKKSAYIMQDRKNRKSLSKIQAVEESQLVALSGGEISLPVHTNRSNFQANDVLVPWKLKDEDKTTFLRFYHVFEEDELDSLCRKIDNIEIVKSYYDQGNWCVLLKKTDVKSIIENKVNSQIQ
ncbi:alkylated DNA repair protein alkB homolog 8 [Euwallacea fornicatus]|uniref:alkylated DNA repair protein alkB homolog 8 n=1 Tax=Euwallacea fornicatus TaxID=995702 RepID=UPI00338DAE04